MSASNELKWLHVNKQYGYTALFKMKNESLNSHFLHASYKYLGYRYSIGDKLLKLGDPP